MPVNRFVPVIEYFCALERDETAVDHGIYHRKPLVSVDFPF